MIAAQEMRWAPEGLALRNQPLRQISQLVWIHPGEGPRGRLCMTWRNYRCEVGGEPKSVCSKCGRRDCPGCSEDWIDATVEGMLERFAVHELLATVIVRDTPDDVNTWKDQRRGVIEEAKAAGIAGGAIVQVDSGDTTQYFVLRPSREGRRMGPRRLRDLLRKSCFPKGSNGHALHWFGTFGYRGPKRAGITFPLSNGPIVTGAKYPLVIRCPEHDCNAIYTCTSRNPLGLPVETGPRRRHRRRRRP